MMTTLAAVRLIPIPPALVDNRKIGMDSSSENSSTSAWRVSTGVVPVNMRYLYSLMSSTRTRMSRT
jgi:hypothetical protein